MNDELVKLRKELLDLADKWQNNQNETADVQGPHNIAIAITVALLEVANAIHAVNKNEDQT